MNSKSPARNNEPEPAAQADATDPRKQNGTRKQIKNKVSLILNQNQQKGLRSSKRLFNKFQATSISGLKLQKSKILRLKSQEKPDKGVDPKLNSDLLLQI